MKWYHGTKFTKNKAVGTEQREVLEDNIYSTDGVQALPVQEALGEEGSKTVQTIVPNTQDQDQEWSEMKLIPNDF